MHLPESLEGYYYQQGYNYRDWTPDHSVKLGGGCQASALLIAMRLMEDNIALTMDNVEIAANRLGLAFLDKEYATRISYASIPIIAAFNLPRHSVKFYNKKSLQDIEGFGNTTFFGNEANRVYLNMPRISNLESNFGVTLPDQIENMKRVLQSGGVAIPLVHGNTLYDSKDHATAKMFHAIVLGSYNAASDTVRIVDPSPGFSHIPSFEKLRDEGKLRIRANSVRRLSSIKAIAKKFHPLGSIDYELPMSKVTNSLRVVSTTIEPTQ